MTGSRNVSLQNMPVEQTSTLNEDVFRPAHECRFAAIKGSLANPQCSWHDRGRSPEVVPMTARKHRSQVAEEQRTGCRTEAIVVLPHRPLPVSDIPTDRSDLSDPHNRAGNRDIPAQIIRTV